MLLKLYRNFSQNLKLRHKLIYAYTLLIIVPIIIVGELSYSQSESFLINEAVRSLESELIQITDDINYKLDLCRKESELLLFDRQFNKILHTDYTNDIKKLNEAYIDIIMPKFENLRTMQTDIKVYTANNSLVFGNKNILSIDEIKNNPLYESIFAEKRHIAWLPVTDLAKSTSSNYTFYRVRNVDGSENTRSADNISYEKVLTLSRAVYDNSDSLQAVIDVYLPVSTIDSVLNNINLPDEGSWAYYGSDGGIITALDSINPDEEQVADILLSGYEFGTIYSENKILVYRKTSLNSGTVILSYPMSYISSRVKVIRNITRWTAAVSIVIVILMSYFLSSLITRRLGRLMSKITRIHDTGEADATLIIPGNDEIAKIDKMFNIMMSRVNYLKEQHLKSEVSKRVMEMEILQAQINPHFLYNSLSSIKWALNNPKIEYVDSVIDSLVRFYRLGLSKGREFISVKEELEIVREYVNIQKFTYDAVFELIYDVNEEVYDYYCIKLILQPFVENAILHGINQNKKDSYLKIGAYPERGKIDFVIEDNGKGFDTAILSTQEDLGDRAAYKGFGIKNAVRRIKLTYKEQCDVCIQSSPGAGTKVIIEIPALTYQEINQLFRQTP
ncbi:MAG: sensor histidine kinase [Caldicoprobacterales bacterium]|jgi:two-component system sensor histidine kinase YesM